MNHLERLTPELQLYLLICCATPNDLRNFIQASPRLFQVYLLNKQHILSAIARAQFHPAVLPETLALAALSKFEKPLSRDTIIEFCSFDLQRYDDLNCTLVPVAEAIDLCRIANDVGYFIEDFARNTLPIMDDHGRFLDKKPQIFTEYRPRLSSAYSNLSNTEIGRLQRAFSRFETYRTLFARCSPQRNHQLQRCNKLPTFNFREQAKMYFQGLPDYQIVEIACVRDYLFRRLRGIFDQLESEAVNTLSPNDFCEGDQRELLESEQYLFSHSGKHSQPGHIEHLMSLGLSTLRGIIESRGEQKRELFVRHVNYPNSEYHYEADENFITYAIEALRPNPPGDDLSLLIQEDPPFIGQTDPNEQLGVPAAWEWAHRGKMPWSICQLSMKGHRDWGYVFWDLERLQQSRILQRDSDAIRVCWFDEVSAMRGLSVEDRVLLKYHVPAREPFFPNDDYDLWSDVEEDGGVDESRVPLGSNATPSISPVDDLDDDQSVPGPSVLWGILESDGSLRPTQTIAKHDDISPGPSLL